MDSQDRRKGSYTYLAPLCRKNAPDGLNHKLEVRPSAALVDVKQVEVNPLVEANLVAVLSRLPVARNTWLHEQTLALVRSVEVCLSPECGTRTYNAHVTKEHIEELRQLVDAGLPDEMTNPRDSGVVLDLEDRTVLLVKVLELGQALLCVRVHRAELEHLEGLLVLAHALLHEEDGAGWVVNLNRDGNNYVKPPEQGEDQEAKGDIEEPLDKAVAIPMCKALHGGPDLIVVLVPYAGNALRINSGGYGILGAL